MSAEKKNNGKEGKDETQRLANFAIKWESSRGKTRIQLTGLPIHAHLTSEFPLNMAPVAYVSFPHYN